MKEILITVITAIATGSITVMFTFFATAKYIRKKHAADVRVTENQASAMDVKNLEEKITAYDAIILRLNERLLDAVKETNLLDKKYSELNVKYAEMKGKYTELKKDFELLKNKSAEPKNEK